jgi:hypothetical protein
MLRSEILANKQTALVGYWRNDDRVVIEITFNGASFTYPAKQASIRKLE